MTDSLLVTAADRAHLAWAGTPWGTTFGLELLFDTHLDRGDLAAALAFAANRHPRLRARPRGRYWVPGGPTLPVLETDDWQAGLLDRPFDLDAEAPLRVALAGNRVLLACMHAATDTAGLVGFASTLASALHGSRPSVLEVPRPHPLREPAAWSPRVALEVLRRRRGTKARRATPFPASGPIVPTNGFAAWHEEAAALAAGAERAGTTVTGLLAAALAGACLERSGPGEVVTVFVPVNLRSSAQRWLPVGNYISHALVRFTSPPTPAEAAEAVTGATRGPARYAPLWEGLLGRAKGLLARRDETSSGGGQPTGLEAPVVTVSLNNLGRLGPGTLPGVRAARFHGSNNPLYPTVNIMTVGATTTVCCRARHHHGGTATAEALLADMRRIALPAEAGAPAG